MVDFIFIIIDGILGLLVLALILNAVLSWLIAFDVINLRNRIVAQFAHFLDAVTQPLLAPFRRFIPALGGVDITPILAILVTYAARVALLPWLRGLLIPVTGG